MEEKPLSRGRCVKRAECLPPCIAFFNLFGEELARMENGDADPPTIKKKQKHTHISCFNSA
jgi:hypothetical protein